MIRKLPPGAVAVVVVSSALFVGPPTVAQSATEETASGTSPASNEGWTSDLRDQFLHSSRLLDDPWGGRTWLEERGLTLSLFFNHQYGVNARGGVNTSGAQRHSGSLDYFALFNTERPGLWRGGDFLLLAKTNYNRNINPDVGALSNPIDDADFDKAIWIDQLWYQQQAFNNRVQIRAGYVDLQAIIDRNAYANKEDIQFMNTFLDNNNATIPLKVGFGSALWVRPSEWLELIAGASDADNEIRQAGFDTAFDDFESLLVYGEVGFRLKFSSRRGGLPGNYRFGTFYDPRSKPIFGRSDPVSGEQLEFL